MNPLLAKEIRLLLPGYAMALVLAVLPVWLLPNNPNSDSTAASLYPFSLGATVLALSSFGREFGLNTFPLLLAQPLARSRMWWTKIGVLVCAITILFGAWYLSCAARSYPGFDRSLLGETTAIGAAISVVTIAGGLWTTLLVRQVTGAFWFVILVPAAISVAIMGNGGTGRIAFAALGVYSVAGFLWAWWQFLRAQETAWTGGVISFARGRERGVASGPTLRVRRPLRALLSKEIQLHQVTLAGMAGLLVLHLGVIALRKAGYNAFGEVIQIGLECFGLLWLVVPLFVGCTSVAEERKLGTMEGHLGLPISSRSQFIAKLLFVVLLGGILSPGFLCAVEAIGRAVPVGHDPGTPFHAEALGVLFLGFSAISLIAFYASTLTRSLLQSLALAVVMTIGLAVIWAIALNPETLRRIFGVRMWTGDLLSYLGWPILVATLIWLAYGNFRRLSENRHLWLRNSLGLSASLVLIAALTGAIYIRAWEFLRPIEPPHGPSRLWGVKRPSLHTEGGNAIAVLLPDGRLWVDRIDYQPGARLLAGTSLGGKWTGQSGTHFLEGSNWVDGVVGLATVAIRSDGTLWVSDNPRSLWNTDRAGASDRLAQFGEDTNWIRVVRDSSSMSKLLLKGDGTLWRWGTTKHFGSRHQWPGLRSFEPYRLGSESDWAEITSTRGSVYAWKKDGQAWVLHPHIKRRNIPTKELEPGVALERWEGFDGTKWRSLTYETGVREDGSLWVFRSEFSLRRGFSMPIVQVGKGTNWVAAVTSGPKLLALKTDGSLWQWEFSYSQGWVLPEPPVRLGIHNDWVAINNLMGGVVSLAADGSLWLWWSQADDQPLLAASRKPVNIGNLFETRDLFTP